jgi:hypothetical protein
MGLRLGAGRGGAGRGGRPSVQPVPVRRSRALPAVLGAPQAPRAPASLKLSGVGGAAGKVAPLSAPCRPPERARRAGWRALRRLQGLLRRPPSPPPCATRLRRAISSGRACHSNAVNYAWRKARQALF